MKSLLIGIFFLALVKNGMSLKCYECTDCKSNDKECTGTSTSCFKAEVAKGDDKIISKGCGLPAGVPLMGEPENTCKSISVLNVDTHICTCLTDLCNNANVHAFKTEMIIFSLIIVKQFM
uniref:Uncharacterized protein n=1 Tax=Strigamia maritima TaxID=126957 RepID=T1JCL3_STRMM